jgi:pimeloyl-ACP methyl ester carboxylesterase
MPDDGPVPNATLVPGEALEVRPGRILSVAIHHGAERDRTAIFLCHGAGGNKNQWRNQWRRLTALGYRVIAWDFPGHGHTPRARDAAGYDGEAFLADYQALVDRHGAARNMLIGHSYGARLTLCLLIALKTRGDLNRIDRAILLGAPPPVPTLGLGPIATWPLPVLVAMRPLLGREFVRRAWAPTADAALVRHEDLATRRNSLFMMKALMTRSARLEAGDLPRLALPILILAGEYDGLTPPAGAQALAGLLPDARLEILAHCGHQIMLEQPECANSLILDFMGADRAQP